MLVLVDISFLLACLPYACICAWVTCENQAQSVSDLVI